MMFAIWFFGHLPRSLLGARFHSNSRRLSVRRPLRTWTVTKVTITGGQLNGISNMSFRPLDAPETTLDNWVRERDLQTRTLHSPGGGSHSRRLLCRLQLKRQLLKRRFNQWIHEWYRVGVGRRNYHAQRQFDLEGQRIQQRGRIQRLSGHGCGQLWTAELNERRHQL